jgi:PAS domain S-box-containing protein
MPESGFNMGRSSPALMAIFASAIASLTPLGWILGKSGDHPSLALIIGGAVFSLILVSLVGWTIYRGAAARVRAEDALRDSEERFRLFVEGAPEYAIILLDREGCVVGWNAGAERIKGFKAEEIVGRSFSLFYPPEDVAAGKPAMELKLAAELGRWEGDGWRVRADGTRFWANVLITALKDDTGNVRGFSKLTRDITEHKRAEEALLKAGALQTAIFNSANFSSIATDAKGIIQIFNVGAERMLGYAAAEVMNKITPADISDPQEIIARAGALSLELRTPITPGFEALVFKASRGIEDIYELTYVRKDGSRFPAVVSVTALRDAQDAIIGYLLIGTDNTARKRAEEALLKAGALQSAIFNSANFSSIATDAKGIIQIFNVGAERMLGYAAAEVMNKITPADMSDPQEIVARAVTLSRELRTPITPGFEALVFKASRGIEDIYELTYVRKDGSRFPAVVSVTALRDAQDAIIGYLLIGTDNTARKLADEALRKNEAQLHTIIENLDEGVLVCDLDGELLHSNRAVKEIHGFASLEELRRNLGNFAGTFEVSGIDGASLGRDELPLARILRGEKLHGVELRVRRIQGDWQRVCSYGGTLVQDADGHPLMAVVTISDITERRQAADLIHQLNTDLERRVVERTAQLQSANNELEAFCYSVSHDLRAPLRSLDGFSQALLEDYSDKLDAQGQNYLGRIRAGSQRMGQLIDDLLSLSRVSRGEVSRELVDLSKMAHEVADELRATAPQRDAEFVVAEGLIAKTDPRLLRIVLTNLFGNAWKFTAKRPHARIEFGSTGENRGKEYFMRDNGAGFDQAYSSKLFGAFQRLHAASDFPGTGIGLATVQRIIQRQGGRVWAEGKVEQGATFHFTL